MTDYFRDERDNAPESQEPHASYGSPDTSRYASRDDSVLDLAPYIDQSALDETMATPLPASDTPISTSLLGHIPKAIRTGLSFLARKASQNLGQISANIAQGTATARDNLKTASSDIKEASKTGVSAAGSIIASGVKNKWSSLLGKAKAAAESLNTKTAEIKNAAVTRTADATSSAATGAKSIWSSLTKRAKAVGEVLKNPETIKQAASSVAKSMFTLDNARDMAVGAGVMGVTRMVAGTALVLTTGPGMVALAGVTASTALVGGLLKSNKQYKEAKAEFEKDEANDGAEFQNRLSFLSENKKQFLKNAFGSAVSGAIGGAIVAEIAQHVDFASMIGTDHTATVAAPTPHDVIVTDANEIPFAPPEVAVPETPLNQAIALLEARPDITEQMKNSIAHAKLGQEWAIRDIAYYINTDGITSNDHLVSGIINQIDAPAAPVHVPAPVTTAAELPASRLGPNFLDGLVPEAPEATVDIPAADAGLSIEEKAAIGAGGAVIGGGLVAAGADQLARNALGDIKEEPKSREQARYEQVLEKREMGIPLLQNGYIGMEKGVCYIAEETPIGGTKQPERVSECESFGAAQEGDYVTAIGRDTGLKVAVIIDAPVGKKIDTECFQRKITSIRSTFNTLLAAVAMRYTPVAYNDNEVPARQEMTCSLN